MQNHANAERTMGDATLDRYLSAILALSKALPVVRSVDVAGSLGCSRACVSMAMKQMKRQALVRVGDHGALALTDEGLRRAESRQRRCDFFESLLVRSGVDADTAAQEAQAVTHALSVASAEALKARLEAQ